MQETNELLKQILSTLNRRESRPVDSGQQGEISSTVQDRKLVFIKPNEIKVSGKGYTRETHPLLFQVIDLLIDDAGARELSARKLEAITGVSKSWCAVAKNYWKTL